MEVASLDLLRDLLNEPLILLFVILFLGSWLGQTKIKGIGLGNAGVLLVAMIFGHFGYQISPVIQNLGLSLFIVAIGLQAGPRFFRMMRTNGLTFGSIGVSMVLIAVITTILIAKIFDLPAAISAGLMTGALTSTPGLAAALHATKDSLTSVGYGIAYPLGMLTIILFVQVYPRLFKIDLQKDLEESTNPIRTAESPEVVTYEVTNPELHKKTIKELNFSQHSIVISRVIRRGHMVVARGETVLLLGDKLVAVGTKEDLRFMDNFVGPIVETTLENDDNITFRKIVVDSDEMIGKSIKDLRLREVYGTTITSIERDGIVIKVNPSMPLLRGDVLVAVSTEKRLEEVEKLFSRKKLAVTNIHVFSLSLILLIGIILGKVPLNLPGLGGFTLGIAGGPLLVSLIIGHFGKLGPIHVRYYAPSNLVIQELGLVMFLAGAGTTAGQGIVEVIKEQGWILLILGLIITIMPIIIGYFMARKIFKLSIVHSLSIVCGGLTSTPAVSSLKHLVDSDEPTVAFAATYPFALIMMAVSAQLIIFFI